MKKEQLQELFDKYYKAETSLQEEAELRKEPGAENDLFAWYEKESFVPENLEEVIFRRINEREIVRKNRRKRIIQYSSVAATIAILISIFLLNPTNVDKPQLSQDDQFKVLEQALAQVSYSLQPAEDDDLLVVFQDENFEIVMN